MSHFTEDDQYIVAKDVDSTTVGKERYGVLHNAEFARFSNQAMAEAAVFALNNGISTFEKFNRSPVLAYNPQVGLVLTDDSVIPGEPGI